MKLCSNSACEIGLQDESGFAENRKKPDGLQNWCKACRRRYYRANQEIFKERSRKHYGIRREENLRYARARYQACRGKALEYAKEYRRLNKPKIAKEKKEYRKNNINKVRKYWNDHVQKRYRSDLVFKIKHCIRALIRGSFKRRGYSKNSRTAGILGCSFEEAQWWLIETAIQNYGEYDTHIKYEIDHIAPLKTAATEDDVVRLCHISNLQYLTPADNNAKRAKLDWKLPR